MSRREVAGRLDEILAFAGIEKFADTPVKRYSSGMYVRLAFSVAAHLDPDVLIADEVLAVGDAEFQRKSIGEMRAVAEGGRTVIFVSHNHGLISALCNRAIWLDKGVLMAQGAVEEVMTAYAASLQHGGGGDVEPPHRQAWERATCRWWRRWCASPARARPSPSRRAGRSSSSCAYAPRARSAGWWSRHGRDAARASGS